MLHRKLVEILGWCLSAAVLALAIPVAAHAAPPGKVTICHVPFDTPTNVQTISVSVKALPDHLGHGDTVGECVPPTSTTTTTSTTSTSFTISTTSTTAGPSSCDGYCGSSPPGSDCYCDTLSCDFGDGCADRDALCPEVCGN